MKAGRRWSLAVLAFVAVAGLLSWAGAPTPALFAALVGGGVLGVTSPTAPQLPAVLRQLGMAIVGVAAGATINADVLKAVAREPVAVPAGVLLTLGATMLIGQLLNLHPGVSGTTAAFASIAGGASGVSLMAKEFGADAQVVLSAQYLRVIVVLVSVPLVAPLLGGARPAASGASTGVNSSVGADLAYTGICLLVGMVLARLARFGGAGILVPLVVSSAVSVWGVFGLAHVPGWLLTVGYTLVGLYVGVGFTRDQLRTLAGIFPLALVSALLGMAACAGIGVAFAHMVGVSPLDGYLATTPGGLPAVTAVAVDSGDEVGLILTMQCLRILLALLCAPLLGAWLRRRPRGNA
ncbi:AbrB family transcriptional regulator [Pedococcus sp. 5OH_020]|uniref:AbrB family transcriptional regulator n=1 Tax=Pedococcus sp. 5OH_020 TaxID=2989814 RepID=UPI0022E9E3D8|nr:AbrB family transcriptional regulator [Pedococcus sp. 5OH_020]